jgi:hypothetical protein
VRRTFASLLYEAGASPAYVMSQMGHTSSAVALEVYKKVMERKRDTGARMDAPSRALGGHKRAQVTRRLRFRWQSRKQQTSPKPGFREAAGQGLEP